MNGFQGMHQTNGGMYLGEHHETSGVVTVFEEAGLLRTDSMDIVNDPRFFTDNVLNYRIQAFLGTSVVSGLMIGNVVYQLFGMSKEMPIFNSVHMMKDVDGMLQFVAFFMLTWILFANFLAVYVGVAQPYHTYRLMTAGPTGFDAAASYYLNRNIVAWRHMAIKGMLQSIPVYLFQMGLRLVVKLDRDNTHSPNLPKVTPEHSRIQGIVFCVILQILAALLVHVHHVHFNIFRERYEVMTEMVKPMQGYMSQMMMPRSTAAASGRAAGLFGFLDV